MFRYSILLTLLSVSLCCAQTLTASSSLAAPTVGYCYYPGANPAGAQNDRPCDPRAETSMCCPIGWTCMSNKICQVTDGSLAQAAVGSIRRGTCTDPSWNNATCGDFCLNLPSFENEGGLIPCGDNVFVCAADANHNNANCAEKQNVFTIPVGAAETIISLSSGTTSTRSIPVSSTAASTLVTSARASGAAANSTVPSEEKHDDDNSHTLPIALGAGIGGAAALAIILIVAIVCIRRRRRNRDMTRYETPDSIDKPETIPMETHYPPPVHHVPEVPRLPPTQPPAGAPMPPDSDPHDGRERYPLFDDGETEIASGGAVGARPAAAPPSRRPDHLETVDRENAGVHGRAYVGSAANTTLPPIRSASPLVDPPVRGASPTYTSTYDGSRADLLGPNASAAATVGRVSPVNDRGRDYGTAY